MEVEGEVGGAVGDVARKALREAELASRVAVEDVNLRILGVRLRKAELTTRKGDADESARIETMRTALAAARGGADDGYRDLLTAEASLRRQREAGERRLATVELRLKSVGAQYARDPIAGENLLALAESLSSQRDTIRHEIALLDARIDRLNSRTSIWHGWEAALVSTPTPEERAEEARRLRERLGDLSHAAQRIQVQIEAQDRVLENLEGQLARPSTNPSLRDSVLDHRDDLTRLQADERTSLDEIRADIRVTERYVEELAGSSRAIDFAELADEVRGKLRAIWEYEITSVEDSPITVGSFLLAMLLMGTGLWVSRRLAVWVGRVAEQRLKLDVGAASSIQTLLFYILLVSFGLFALRAIHFPLTAFTVLGGALAIGVGFGSQNVMNNFISGPILMLERPVRAHDTVEVDGSHGTIETNVVNWTLSDDLIRTSVLVGVIYGSPTRLVAELIQCVVEGIEEIHSHPAPIILFDEFGDNSLNFEVHFWLSARGPMEKRKVESRVRFGIDDLFREHSLVIAFPQRDVHLDTLKPLEVRLLDRDDEHTHSPDQGVA